MRRNIFTTLIECIIKAVADNCQKDEYLKATHGGNKSYEIKSGIGCYSKPTACKPDDKGNYQATILLNQDGIWLINSKDVAKYLNEKGCLPFRGECGRHYKRLEKIMGYNL